jgi:hypothetical protein
MAAMQCLVSRLWEAEPRLDQTITTNCSSDHLADSYKVKTFHNDVRTQGTFYYTREVRQALCNIFDVFFNTISLADLKWSLWLVGFAARHEIWLHTWEIVSLILPTQLVQPLIWWASSAKPLFWHRILRVTLQRIWLNKLAHVVNTVMKVY